MSSSRWIRMGNVRPVVIVVVVGLLVGAVALLVLDRRDDDRDAWERVAVTDVAFSSDRRTVFALEGEYRSPSCHEHRVTVDRDGSAWTVRLEARRASDFCTLEGCIAGEEAGDSFAMPDEPDRDVGCPPVHALDLDDPAPTDVELRVAG